MATVKTNGVGDDERDLRRAVLLERSRRRSAPRRPTAMSPAAARSALDASEAAVRRLAAHPAA